MTDMKLRPISTVDEANAAIAEATRRHPDDADAAVDWLLATYAMTPLIAEALAHLGRRELEAEATQN